MMGFNQRCELSYLYLYMCSLLLLSSIINSKPEDVLRMELDTHCIVHMVNFQYVFNDEDAGPSDLRNQLPINPGATELV